VSLTSLATTTSTADGLLSELLSTTTSPTTAGAVLAALSDDLQRDMAALVGQLMASGSMTANATSDLGTAKAFQLPGSGTNESYTAFTVEGAPVATVLPQQVREMGSNKAAAPAVDVSIVDTRTLMTQDVSVEGALIYVRVTEQEPKANFMCAYMAGPDFAVWSTQGVRLATEAELADLALQTGSSKLSGTWCAT
ncbi:SYT4, partial [Symbiodinium sp. CCMP2456]